MSLFLNNDDCEYDEEDEIEQDNDVLVETIEEEDEIGEENLETETEDQYLYTLRDRKKNTLK